MSEQDDRTPPTDLDAAAVEGCLGKPVSPAFYRALWAICETLFAADRQPPAANRTRWVCDELVDFVSHAGVRSRWMMRLLVFYVGTVGAVLALRPPPFRLLNLADRVRGLQRLESSPLALPLFGLKALLCLVYYEHPEHVRAIGWTGASEARFVSLQGDES